MSKTPVFQKELHRLRPNAGEAIPIPKSKKRNDNSRDLREDRGEREIKTSRPRTFPHGR